MSRFRPSQFTVKLGEWDLKDNDIYSQEFRVVEITAHPDFKANGFYNDVAIFKLDQPVYFNEYVLANIFLNDITYYLKKYAARSSDLTLNVYFNF